MKSPEEQYREALGMLASQHGERNRRLIPLAIKARNAGVAETAAIEEIIAFSGADPLTHAEVARAVSKVYTGVVGADHRAARPVPRPQPRPSTSTSSSPSFVRDMIAKGGGEASSADLMALSPIAVRDQAPWLQAASLAMRLEEGADELYFFGEPKMRRTRDRLMTMAELQTDLIMTTDTPTIPTHFLPNVLTGTPVKNEKGEDSYACEACLAHRRYAVVEFDDLPLREQAAFWIGFLKAKIAPIRSLVYSGGKSIHALWCLDETRDFAAQWQAIERVLASDPDRRYRCDLACRNPGRLTRFPGAIRPETNRRQTLLYLG